MEVAAPFSPKNRLASSESCETSNVEALLFRTCGLPVGPCISSSESSEKLSVVGVVGLVSILEAVSEYEVERPLFDGSDCNDFVAESERFLVSEGSSGTGSFGCEWAVRGSRCPGAVVAAILCCEWNV